MTDPTPTEPTAPEPAQAPPEVTPPAAPAAQPEPAPAAPAPAAPAPAAPAPPAPSTWAPPAAGTTAGARPTGITILAVLAALGAIGGLFAGFGAFAIGTLVFGFSGALFGLAWLALAALGLAFAVGAWQVQPWAWPLGVVLAAAAIIWSVVVWVGGDGSLINVLTTAVIYGVVLYYLNQPGINALFGRA